MPAGSVGVRSGRLHLQRHITGEPILLALQVRMGGSKATQFDGQSRLGELALP